MSPIILDIILAGIIVAICVNGYIQGLVVSLFNLLSSIAAVVISFIAYPAFTALFKATPVYEAIRGPIYNSVNSLSQGLETVTPESLVSALKLPQAVSDSILSRVSEGGTDAGAITSNTSDVVTDFLLQIISIVLIFIIVKLLLLLLKKVVKQITKLPLIRQVDKFGGIVIGLFEAFVLLTVVGALFALFSGSVDSGVLSAVEGSVIGRFFYDGNLLMGLLSGKL